MTGAGRFAPSPTSDLHLGNLRTALLAWLLARQQGLAFLVRDEDLDQARVAAAPRVDERQLADLAALGLDWDGPVVHQSQRTGAYTEAVERLDTYECFCTRREIAEASVAPHGATYRPYPGTCAHLSRARIEELRRTRPAALRVRAEGATWSVQDAWAGTVTGVVDDFVLFRNDGTPAYNLAVVVDDGRQGVTQVCRGRDLLDSSPRQAWLATTLGFVQPSYAHVGLVLGPGGQRLAKRDGAVTLTDLAKLGHSASEVVSMLAASVGLPTGLSPAELLDWPGLPDALANPRLAEDWSIQAG